MINDKENLAVKLCEVLKLNPNETTSIDITIYPDDCVYVTIGRKMFIKEMEEIVEVLKQYTLEETDKTSEIGNIYPQTFL